jgi:hypothetical protein
MKLKAPMREILPDGVYRATLVELGERESENGPFLLWRFRVVMNGRAIEVTATSSRRFGSKAKARHWAELLLGERIADGNEVETDDLVGRACSVVLETIERNGERFNEIKALSRPPSPESGESQAS